MASKHFGEFELLDSSNSRASFSFNFGAITAVSLPGFLTNFGNLRSALGGITVGTISRERWTGDSTVLSNIPPSNPQATRFLVWEVHFVDTFVGGDHYTSIATPDTTFLSPDYEDQIDYDDPLVQAFITAFETLVRVPIAGGEYPVIVEHITLRGQARRQSAR